MSRSKKTSNGLTEKQSRFCVEYVDNGGCATEAYRIVYDCTNMKDSTIYSEASRLLNNPHIATRIFEIKEHRANRQQRGRDICNRALLDIVETTTDDLHYIDPHTGKIKTRAPHQLPQRARNAIKKMGNNNGHVYYELNGKIEAIKQYAAMNGLNSAQEVNVNSKGGMFGEIRIGFDDESEWQIDSTNEE